MFNTNPNCGARQQRTPKYFNNWRHTRDTRLATNLHTACTVQPQRTFFNLEITI